MTIRSISPLLVRWPRQRQVRHLACLSERRSWDEVITTTSRKIRKSSTIFSFKKWPSSSWSSTFSMTGRGEGTRCSRSSEVWAHHSAQVPYRRIGHSPRKECKCPLLTRILRKTTNQERTRGQILAWVVKINSELRAQHLSQAIGRDTSNST